MLLKVGDAANNESAACHAGEKYGNNFKTDFKFID